MTVRIIWPGGPGRVLARTASAAQSSAVELASPAKRVEIARWFYARALREARVNSTPLTWATLLRAAQNLRYAIVCLEKARAAEARRQGSIPTSE
jgi:hypothetical protein